MEFRNERCTRRQFNKGVLEKAIEWGGRLAVLGSTAGMVNAASTGEAKTVEVTAESLMGDYEDTGAFLERTAVISDITAQPRDALGRLYDIWKKYYYQTSCTTTFNESGDAETRCHDYWNEPSSLVSVGIDNQVIYDSAKLLDQVFAKNSDLLRRGPNAFDLSKGQSGLGFTAYRKGLSGQVWWAVPSYGAVGLGLAFYEGVANRLSGRFAETYQRGSGCGGKYIGRRALLKAGLGLWGLKVVGDATESYIGSQDNALNDTRAYADDVLARKDTDDSGNFARFYGARPEEVRGILQYFDDRSRQVLRNYQRYVNLGVHWDVLLALSDVSKHVRNGLDAFDGYFDFDVRDDSYVVPLELTEFSKNLWATDEIKGFAHQKGAGLSGWHLWYALKVGVVWSAAVAGMEFVSRRVIPKISA